MTPVEPFEPLERLDRVLGNVLAAMLAAAVVAVLWQVVSRYVLGDPSSFTGELVRFLLVWLGLLGGAFAAGRRLHLAIDLLPERLAPAPRLRLAAVVQVLVGLFSAAVLILGGGNLVTLTLSLGQRSAALGVPLGAVYSVLPLSGLVLVLYSAAYAADSWRRSGAGASGEEP